METEDQNLKILLKWASEIGITDSPLSPNLHPGLGHSLSVSHFPEAGGRGLAASRELRKGDLVLRVPKSALMTTRSLATDESLASALGGHSPPLSPLQKLGVGLLYEMDRGKNSRWYPFLLNLPRGYNTLSTFGDFEKQALQVDEAIWAAEKAVSKAELEWKEAYALMKELKLKPRLLTFRAWLWASATICSRTLHVAWDKAGCLCPVGDLFNYAAPSEESSSNLEQLDSDSNRLTDGGFEDDVSAYCFYARRNYKKGEQVLLCYGTYTNLELLEHYGFVLNENPNDKVFIPLEPEICSSATWPKESMYIQENGKPSFALLCALRLWKTPRNERKSVARHAYAGSQLSAKNETSVMRWLWKRCDSILKNLPSSSESDRLLLNSIYDLQGPCSSELKNSLMRSSGEIRAFLEAHGLQNWDGKTKLEVDKWRLAIEWRVGYKEIVMNCMCYCSQCLESQDLSSESTP